MSHVVQDFSHHRCQESQIANFHGKKNPFYPMFCFSKTLEKYPKDLKPLISSIKVAFIRSQYFKLI
jgi:hypothetical protein